MLSIIPAVLLLILRGPAGVEHSQVDGKLGQALKIWAAKQARAECEIPQSAAQQAKKEICALLALSQAAPGFSRFVAQVFELSESHERPADGVLVPSDSSGVRVNLRTIDTGSLQRGFFRCIRSRDGPFLCS